MQQGSVPWRYKSNKVKLGDEVIEIPWGVVRTQGPGYLPSTRRNSPQDYVVPKSFANPNERGYGSEQWPFDIKRAYTDGRYRSGIRNAIAASWTASNWKYAARVQLQKIIEDLLALYDIPIDE